MIKEVINEEISDSVTTYRDGKLIVTDYGELIKEIMITTGTGKQLDLKHDQIKSLYKFLGKIIIDSRIK